MKLLRNYIIVLSVVALIAVALATLSVMGYLTKADQVVLSPQDPMTATESETGIPDLARLLTLAFNNASLLNDSPVLPEETVSVDLQTKTAGGRFVGAYSLHVISMIDRNALLEDLSTGEYYRISARDFETLLSHQAFSDLPGKRFQEPSLTVDKIHTLWAKSGTIYCYTPRGTFQKMTKATEEPPLTLSLTTEEAAQPHDVTPTNSPDSWSVSVQKDQTEHLTQNRVKTTELYFPVEPGTYTYKLTAHWDLSAQRDWYGDLNYVLEIHIAEPEPPPQLPENPEGETSHP